MSEPLLQADVDWFPLVVFILWVLGSIFGSKKKKRPPLEDDEYEWEEPPPRQRTEQVDRTEHGKLADVLREIERDLGLHTPERPKPQPAPPPRIELPTLEGGGRAEADVAAWQTAENPMIEAQRKAEELRRKKMMAEERRAEIARRRGEMEARSRPAPPMQAAAQSRSSLVASLLGDLTGGGESLPKAVLLREILGPPKGLSDFD